MLKEQLIQEIEALPASLYPEVAVFVGYLKHKELIIDSKNAKQDTITKETQLNFPFHAIDTSSYAFNREEANER